MVDFNEKIPNGLPKLPDNYWEVRGDEKTEQPAFNIFDKNIKATMDDICVFKKNKLS